MTHSRFTHVVLLCLALPFALLRPAAAQISTGDKGTLGGLVFGDYYWMAQNHDPELEGENGFWFRRIYLTYDHQISEAFSGRLRLEMNSEGDFTTDASLNPEVNDAWLQWTNVQHTITAGISPTPTWDLTDEIWGYRSVEKSALDLYDFGSSRDFGLSLKGRFTGAEKLSYHFMFANGSGDGTELNKGKKLMLALGYNLTEQWVVQGYVDWDDRPGNRDTYTAQGVLGYQSETFNAGALYAYQFRKNTEFAGDMNLELISVFANARLNKRLTFFARADHLFDQNPDGPGNAYLPISDRTESTFLTSGMDISLHPDVHLLPNIEAVVYGEDAGGDRPRSDLIPRLTLFYTF
jgi:hypothetical protein